jgi:hypothetical protein
MENTCTTCAEMTQLTHETTQELIQLRRTNDTLFRELEELRETNLVLGRRNRVLQRHNVALQDQADALFLALSEQDEQEGIST